MLYKIAHRAVHTIREAKPGNGMVHYELQGGKLVIRRGGKKIRAKEIKKYCPQRPFLKSTQIYG